MGADDGDGRGRGSAHENAGGCAGAVRQQMPVFQKDSMAGFLAGAGSAATGQARVEAPTGRARVAGLICTLGLIGAMAVQG